MGLSDCRRDLILVDLTLVVNVREHHAHSASIQHTLDKSISALVGHSHERCDICLQPRSAETTSLLERQIRVLQVNEKRIKRGILRQLHDLGVSCKPDSKGLGMFVSQSELSLNSEALPLLTLQSWPEAAFNRRLLEATAAICVTLSGLRVCKNGYKCLEYEHPCLPRLVSASWRLVLSLQPRCSYGWGPHSLSAPRTELSASKLDSVAPWPCYLQTLLNLGDTTRDLDLFWGFKVHHGD